MTALKPMRWILFQSTLPAKGATHFEPGWILCSLVSIHAPREGSDDVTGASVDVTVEFQSTLPAKGATAEQQRMCVALMVSIHAPREGSDQVYCQRRLWVYVSIHAPREGSDPFMVDTCQGFQVSIHAPREGSDFPLWVICLLWFLFQSTLPAKGATV